MGHTQSLHSKLNTIGLDEGIIIFDNKGYSKLMRAIGAIQTRSTKDIKALRCKKAECIISNELKTGVYVYYPKKGLKND